MKLWKQYCNENDVKIVFTSFKISNYFSAKDVTPYFLKSLLVYNSSMQDVNLVTSAKFVVIS